MDRSAAEMRGGSALVRGPGCGMQGLVCTAAVREDGGRSFSYRDEQCPPRNALLSRKALALDSKSTVIVLRVCVLSRKRVRSEYD